MKVSCEKGDGRRMLDVLRSAVWLVLLLAQARLKVLARLRRADLLLREGQADLFSGRQAKSSVSQAEATGCNRTVERGSRMTLL